MGTEERRDIRRGGDRIVFDGQHKASETGGKSLDDRIKDHQTDRRQRDSDRRRRDGSPDRRTRRPERRMEDDDRCLLALHQALHCANEMSQEASMLCPSSC